MLTKEEREEIAERVSTYVKKSNSVLKDTYECLIGRPLPDVNETTATEDREVMAERLLDLCDTSNMIELPLDKDGEVIHIGDTVTNGAEGKICRVIGYEFKSGGCAVLLASDISHIWTYSRPDVLTHKKPVTIESLVERFEHVLAKGQMSYWTIGEICDIVDQLKKLGDSDD